MPFQLAASKTGVPRGHAHLRALGLEADVGALGAVAPAPRVVSSAQAA